MCTLWSAAALRALTKLMVSASTDVAGLWQRALTDLVVRPLAIVADLRVGAFLHQVVRGSTIVAAHAAASCVCHACSRTPCGDTISSTL